MLHRNKNTQIFLPCITIVLSVLWDLKLENDGFSSHWGSALKQPLSLRFLLTSGLIWTNGEAFRYLREAMYNRQTSLSCYSFSPTLSHPSSHFNFLIFLSFLLLLHLLPHGSLLLMSLSPCVPPLPPPMPPSTCLESISPTPQCPRCHAVSQINVEILTSDGPARHRSSGGRRENGRRGFPYHPPYSSSLLIQLSPPKLNL